MKLSLSEPRSVDCGFLFKTMTDLEVILTNEKRKFKLVMEMLKQIERVDFETDLGKELHADLKICISEVIRPMIIKKAEHLIS